MTHNIYIDILMTNRFIAHGQVSMLRRGLFSHYLLWGVTEIALRKVIEIFNLSDEIGNGRPSSDTNTKDEVESGQTPIQQAHIPQVRP